MEVLLYGRLADLAGRRLVVDVPEGSSVSALRAILARQHPALAGEIGGRRVRACVGDALVADDQPVTGDRPVEFFPAVSGG